MPSLQYMVGEQKIIYAVTVIIDLLLLHPHCRHLHGNGRYFYFPSDYLGIYDLNATVLGTAKSTAVNGASFVGHQLNILEKNLHKSY